MLPLFRAESVSSLACAQVELQRFHNFPAENVALWFGRQVELSNIFLLKKLHIILGEMSTKFNSQRNTVQIRKRYFF